MLKGRLPSAPGSPLVGTGLAICTLVVVSKGLAFAREAIVASYFGASARSDAYYLAFALPTLIFSVGALPFSMWVTARVTVLQAADARGGAAFARRVQSWAFGVSVLATGAVAAFATLLVRAYAPGLDAPRLAQAVEVTRIGSLAIPGLTMQAVCNGRLFAEGRFVTAYAWAAAGSVAGVVVVLLLAATYGPAGAILSFVGSAWISGLGPLLSLGSGPGLAASTAQRVTWADDLGSGVVYRAVVMQVYLQCSLLVTYAFGSTLPAGELAGTLFGMKIQTAVYETLVVTAGVLVFPRFARHLQTRDHIAVGADLARALGWLLPVTLTLTVLIIVARVELVGLIYQRNAFDARAALMVGGALLGYAPGIVGLTLVEILHRVMVLRGRIGGYVLVMGAALAANALACVVLVPRAGPMGLALGASIGAIGAGLGLLAYAYLRLQALDARRLIRLLVRAGAVASVALIVLASAHAAVGVQRTRAGQLAVLAATGVLAAAIVLAGLAVTGYQRGLHAGRAGSATPQEP